MDWTAFIQTGYRWLITTGAEVVVILVVTLAALRIARLLIRRVTATIDRDKTDLEAKKRAETLESVVRYTLNVTVWVIATIMILGALGIDIGPILAAAGVLGLAVGFGAQSLVQDVISGFFILLEDQIRVGDVVEISGKSGLVERVNLRMIVLRDLSGHVHYVRNNQIDVVTNMTKKFSYYVFDVGVAYREDVDEVIDVMKRVGEAMRASDDFGEDILDDLEVLGLDRLADSAVVIKARFKTNPGKQWRVGREYNRQMKAAFDAEGIEIPFPHTTVYMGEPKDGPAPPVRVELDGPSPEG